MEDGNGAAATWKKKLLGQQMKMASRLGISTTRTFRTSPAFLSETHSDPVAAAAAVIALNRYLQRCHRLTVIADGFQFPRQLMTSPQSCA
jgi:hypothetical protein